MTLWLDAQLPPAIARWIAETLGLEAIALRDLGLRDADDRTIFDAARRQGIVLVSKDQDFVALVQRHGAPPKLVWVTCGNTSNDSLRDLFRSALPAALEQLGKGDDIVELG